jgi:hypothetical protein
MKNKFKESKKIILVFDQDNNFDSISEKYGKTDADIIKNVRWFIGCAYQAITDSYKGDGSQRRLEMNKLYSNLMNQLEEQLTKDEIENILNT